MSLTGLFICLFLVVHLIGNLQLFYNDNGLAFNNYAYFMTHFTPIKVISYANYIIIILHAVMALVLTINNNKARPVRYAVQHGSANSPWTSRNMGILGTVLLIFIVMHMSHFWAEYHYGALPYKQYEISLANPEEMNFSDLPVSETHAHADYVDAQEQTRVVIAKDLYRVVHDLFQEWWYVLFYVISMGALSFHLIHGFRSAFQTIGWDHNKYVPLIRFIGVWIFGVVIPILYAAMPVYFFLCK